MIPIVLTALLFSSLGLAQTPLDVGLVASYLFQGSAADASSYNNDAEVRGATLTEGYDGQEESAYSLDGTDDYLVIPHSESLSLDTRATFSLWWKHERQASQDAYYTLFEKSDPERGGHSRYGMWLIGNHVEVCIEAPDNSAQNCLDSMNDTIRQIVKNRMRACALTQRELAKHMHETNLARLLAGRSEKINEGWQRVLNELGLELVAVPKDTDLSRLEEKGR